eukprot:UN06637
MIILDLWAESFPLWKQFDSFYGKPFIYCILNNFGGNHGLNGNLTSIQPPINQNNTMIGIGLTMEGIWQNYVMYSYALELAWDPKPSNMTSWIENYSIQRYGKINPNSKKAWVLLLQNVYQGGPLGGSSPIT